MSLDLHGIVTAQMCEHADGLHALQTYPHIDAHEAGARAASLLLKLLRGAVRSTETVRVTIPLLCRGNEMITEPHAAGATSFIGDVMRRAVSLEQSAENVVLAANVFWGNPFTDVPELGSAIVLTYDTTAAPAGGESLAAECSAMACELAELMWSGRETMQASLISVTAAVELTRSRLGEASPRNTKGAGRGTVILSDAADATSSGASGNSNAVLRELVAQRYAGKVLFPIVDPDAVAAAQAIGAGNSGTVSLGGSLDPRYEPLELAVKVLSAGKEAGLTRTMAAQVTPFRGGTAVLQYEEMIVIAFAQTLGFHERGHFDQHGFAPEDFDCVVIKTPHAQPEFFDDWCLVNYNVDAEGSTTANVRKLAMPLEGPSVRGHCNMRRPCYPLEGAENFGSGEAHDQHGQRRVLGADFAWQPRPEVFE